MSKAAGKKGGQPKPAAAGSGTAATGDQKMDHWVEYLEKELREQHNAVSQGGMRTLDERINDAWRMNELKLALYAEAWRRGLGQGSGKSDLAAMITQRGCEIAILGISEQARRKQAEKVILQGLVFGLLITAAIALIVLVSPFLEPEEDRDKSPVITKVAILSRDGSKAGVYLELHHNLDDMEGVRSDVATFIQRNFPHIIHDKQMWNGLMTEAKKALKAVQGGAGEGQQATSPQDARQIALVLGDYNSITPVSQAGREREDHGQRVETIMRAQEEGHDGAKQSFWEILGIPARWLG